MTGGRGYVDGISVCQILDYIDGKTRIDEVLTGGAAGADNLAARWAQSRSVSIRIILPDWNKHGRAAGPIRNQQLIDLKPDLVVAFPGGKGTADCVAKAEKAGITVRKVEEQL